MLNRIRKAIKTDHMTTQLSGLSACDAQAGYIEVDEAYFGGRRKGKRGRGAAGKTPVVGIIQRNGSVRTIIVPDVKNATLRPFVKQYVGKGSTIYTDSWKGYKGLKKDGFIHKLVDRDSHLVSDNKDHTNNIGGYWRLSKHKMFARYHKTSKKHLKDYLAEADFKFNQRHNKDFIRSGLIKLLLVP